MISVAKARLVRHLSVMLELIFQLGQSLYNAFSFIARSVVPGIGSASMHIIDG